MAKIRRNISLSREADLYAGSMQNFSAWIEQCISMHRRGELHE